MESFINRETLRNDLLGYATCMFRPTLMTREKVLAVVDNIPDAVVHCRDCKNQETCTFDLGDDGYCSKGAH